MFSFRYTSLVRRNFLRFGKRNGGDGVKIPHIHHGETEEEEENEKLNKFLSFFQHFTPVPVEQEIAKEDEENVISELVLQNNILLIILG